MFHRKPVTVNYVLEPLFGSSGGGLVGSSLSSCVCLQTVINHWWGPGVPQHRHTLKGVCVSDGSFCSLHMICVCWTVVHKTMKMRTHVSWMFYCFYCQTSKWKNRAWRTWWGQSLWSGVTFVSPVSQEVWLIDWLIFQREEDLWASSFHDGLSGCRSANTDHPEEEGGRRGARWATSHTKLKCFYYTTEIHHHDMNHWSSTH